MKKFTAALLIFMVVCSYVINDGIKKADAIVPALGPAVYYGLGSLIVASGVYAATNDDVQYLVEDYWNQASDSIKNLWKNTAIYAGTAGYLLVNQSMISDMTEYLINEKGFISGQNSLNDPIENIYPYVPTDETIILVLSDGSIISTKVGNTLGQYYSFHIFGHVVNLNQTITTTAINKTMFTGDTVPVVSVLEVASTYVDVLAEWIDRNGVSKSSTHRFTIYNPSTILEEADDFQYVGDAAGIGTALEPEDEFKVPCPPIPEIDWPETWLDDLEKALNEADNPFVDDETTIQEGKEEWDWWIDEWGNPYKVRKGEPPRDPQKDKKIGFPIPMPEPNIPEEFPDVNNPEETVIENPPETTSTQNPDGTRTDTTTQTTTITRRWYDPDTEKWKETTTTTTTTTQQDYDPDGLPIGPPRTVVTTPDGPVKTSPPDKDADKIDWQPLKIGIGAITHKFPFSLPWDIYNSFSQFSGTAWDGEFDINIDTILADWVFTIDLSMWENIISIVKKVELMFFDIGLILATRRLMGGGV